MTRRRLLLALGVALAVLVIVVGAVNLLAPPRPGITRVNCARIRVGMRRAEVEAILGGPPGYYHEGRLVSRSDPIERPRGSLPMWAGDEGTVLVWLGPDGRVSKRKDCVDLLSAREPTPFQRLLASIRRLLP